MKKDSASKAEFDKNWYDVWMKQSTEFFEIADKNLKDMFAKNTPVNPENHMKQVQQWLDMWKNHWQSTILNEKQKTLENYWKIMAKMCNDASDLMVEEWTKRAREQNPVKNIHELYELWLNCCNEIYQKSTHTKSYQDAYGEFMNAALDFWKSAIPKK